MDLISTTRSDRVVVSISDRQARGPGFNPRLRQLQFFSNK